MLTLAVGGYRSLRKIVLPLAPLTVITGPNGSGKSNLYRAIRLLAGVAQGGAVGALAREGGLASTLWAGPEQISRAMRSGEVPVEGTRRSGPVSLQLGFADEDFGYAIDLGLPRPDGRTAFGLDPEIKAEALWAGECLRRGNALAKRRGPAVSVMDDRGRQEVVLSGLAPYDSMMTHLSDPRLAPEVITLRDRMRSWRFYDHFRTDAGAPARRPQLGTRTPVLSGDGADLAAAIQTIVEIGDPRALDEAIEDAFPGSSLSVVGEGGVFDLQMQQAGLLRPLRVAELSDGTLRYLLLVAALLSPRPPALLVLNEPETSLHPRLLPALARLIGAAARRSQVIVVSHAAPLVAELEKARDTVSHALYKDLGETLVDLDEVPRWEWPQR